MDKEEKEKKKRIEPLPPTREEDLAVITELKTIEKEKRLIEEAKKEN